MSSVGVYKKMKFRKSTSPLGFHVKRTDQVCTHQVCTQLTQAILVPHDLTQDILVESFGTAVLVCAFVLVLHRQEEESDQVCTQLTQAILVPDDRWACIFQA